MIGVLADPTEHLFVHEFFELFKTPWEFYRRNRPYDVVIATVEPEFEVASNLLVVYAGRKLQWDDGRNMVPANAVPANTRQDGLLIQGDKRIPIYGTTICFKGSESALAYDDKSGECAAYLNRTSDRYFARIGYDLFGEIRKLLTVGQPAGHAGTPSLELHIAFLRGLLIECGISWVEIPPVPEGFQFIACLTHDVDHPSIRQHQWDHTMAGFLFRATFGSLRACFQNRLSFRGLIRNWSAAIRLPLVYLGLSTDFWRDFDRRYRDIEQEIPSTFFLIPRKQYAGKGPSGSAPQFRAARYEAADLKDSISMWMNSGCEVGLHGLDAWSDVTSARRELAEIRRLTGVSGVGLRMHWLYYDQNSPAILDAAGALYDSTVGYNETVGYRAGTTQAYLPPEAKDLLELPLHVMDTALFYPNHLGLSVKQASAVLSRMLDEVAVLGGCLTINWHDRSLAPERLWDSCYRDLVQELKARGAWCGTASQVTSWFRKRRSATFEIDSRSEHIIAKLPGDLDGLPSLRVRKYQRREPASATETSGDFREMSPCEYTETRVPASPNV